MSVLKTLPNSLTLARIVLIPVLIIVFYLPWSGAHAAAAIIFMIASFTDWLDGYFARKLEQMTPFGAFLDPVADKLLVTSCLLLLVGAGDRGYITLPSIVIVGREIVISALREWMAEIGSHASLAVSYVGKVKTTVQMIALILLLACPPALSMSGLLGVFGVLLLYVAAILTIWSMVAYLIIAWPMLLKKTDRSG
ncbi:MAG: CDP-diacylglycerol--glycerol-3-phosphate 3-phosphatidyltransferase [Gammaproteobacteria bacterium]|nr:CDP-diacylglycerol--glycerol-3-phosphate 3-phosphatidyltransferase [Gammaproteobacteria bacterium]MCH9763188.1 CDP-diacylglycerol--glycerol-3-phosphate 3-phosphatidyltransferase [Gammaproteobacteria bacterium]